MSGFDIMYGAASIGSLVIGVMCLKTAYIEWRKGLGELAAISLSGFVVFLFILLTIPAIYNSSYRAHHSTPVEAPCQK